MAETTTSSNVAVGVAAVLAVAAAGAALEDFIGATRPEGAAAWGVDEGVADGEASVEAVVSAALDAPAMTMTLAKASVDR